MKDLFLTIEIEFNKISIYVQKPQVYLTSFTLLTGT